MTDKEFQSIYDDAWYRYVKGGGAQNFLFVFCRAVEAEVLERAATVAHLQNQITPTTTAQLIEKGIRALKEQA